MKFRLRGTIGLTAVLALVLAACGGGAETTTTADGGSGSATTEAMGETTTTDGMAMSDLGLPIIDPLDVTPGEVAIAGSSTVFPLSTAVLTMWEDEGGPQYTLDSIGSGGGFERFCVEGASDISNASRPIKDEEITACESIDREPIEIRVGTDALSLVISSGNYFAQELTIEELATAFSLTDSNATWADVNPAFPAHPIQLFSPGADSGTFDYFNEVVFEEADPSPILSSISQIVGEDDNVTVQGVAEDGCTEGDLTSTCAIGYFGYAYFQENADVLQAVAVDGIAPSADTVNDNTYPLSRPLFMYTAASVIADKPQVAEFIAYYLEHVNELIGEVGYFPAPIEDLQEAAENIKEAAGW
jgi:phosphate transport system substrate-binding protein